MGVQNMLTYFIQFLLMSIYYVLDTKVQNEVYMTKIHFAVPKCLEIYPVRGVGNSYWVALNY